MILNFSNPEKNIKHLKVREGSVVADFGSGSGHYIFPLSDLVGDSGKVYAVDIQKSLLMKIQKDVTQKSIKNIETVWGDLEKEGGSKLRDSSLDYLIASNILFQVQHKESLVKECFRVLKSGGKVLLVDWSESFGGIGPQPENIVDEETSKNMFEKIGFVFEESVPVGNHHYGIIFKKA
ncbi:MAG: class I SAM-dependent methyltransferase [Candidatus Paceibacterota bacterium]